MKPDTKEILGITADDLWGYPSVAMLLIALFLEPLWLVAGLLMVSTIFLFIYLKRISAKYQRSDDIHLKPSTIKFRRCFNIVWVVFHFGLISAKIVLLRYQLLPLDMIRNWAETLIKSQ